MAGGWFGLSLLATSVPREQRAGLGYEGSKSMRTYLVLINLVFAVGLSAETFRAASVKVDITPTNKQWLAGYGARQSTGVLDHIYHRVVALDDGRAPFFLVSSELCVISPAFYDEATAELQRATGIEPGHVWWTVTHTHSAPEVGPPGLPKVMMPERYKHDFDHDYAELVKRTLINAVKEARANLTPARLAVTTGRSVANINRRARDPDGRISLGLNPEGPADRQIGLIRLTGTDGSLIALIANYAMHGTVLGAENLLISGDAPGIVTTYVEQKLGAPVLFINGAAGNLAPIYSVQSLRNSHIKEFNVLLGDRILAANSAMGAGTAEIKLQTGEKIIETPLNKAFHWDDALQSYLRVTPAGDTLVRIPIRFLTLGNDIAVWAAPVELFCEIAAEIRNRSSFPYTFYFGYANGWLGYVPTRQAFAEGGYEVKTSPFTDRVEEDLTQGALAYLEGMRR